MLCNEYIHFMSTQKKKIIFVINPISGTQNKKSIINQLNEGVDSTKYDWEIKYTKKAGHAVDIAAQAAQDGIDIVGAVGGDGTINEIGRSLIDTQTALAILPLGSGNGFARHLNIPMDVRKAIDVINTGVIEAVDYGKINGIPFFCTCGVGFDAFVSLKFAESGRRGVLTYLEKTLLESLNYQPERYELEIDNETIKYKAFLIACGNASQYGNNAYIAPQATVTDGLLDVTILEPFTVLDVPSLSFQLFNKTIDQNSHIKTFRCRNLSIRRAASGVIHFDGDPIMTGADIHIEAIPAGLRVLVPQEKREVPKSFDVLGGLKMFNEIIANDIERKKKALLDKSKNNIKHQTEE